MTHYEKLLKEGKKRVADMDRIDGGPEADRLSCSAAIRTVMTCLECGVRAGDWSNVADALVMLDQIERRYRPADEQAKGSYLDAISKAH